MASLGCRMEHYLQTAWICPIVEVVEQKAWHCTKAPSPLQMERSPDSYRERGEVLPLSITTQDFFIFFIELKNGTLLTTRVLSYRARHSLDMYIFIFSVELLPELPTFTRSFTFPSLPICAATSTPSFSPFKEVCRSSRLFCRLET